MTGASWIRVILTISDHFAFLVRSEKCLENVILIFFGSYCKMQGEKTKFQNRFKTHSKSGKRLKPKAIPSFLGDVGHIKVVSEFLFGHPKCHFLWTLLAKVPIFMCPKMALRVPEQKF